MTGVAAAANFRVTISGSLGGRIFPSFYATSVSQLSLEIEPNLIEQGGEYRTIPTRLPNLPPRVRIEIPISIDRTEVMEEWWREVTDSGKPLSKRIIDITLTDSQDAAIYGYRLKRAWPCGWGLSPVRKDSSPEILTEFFVIVCEELVQIKHDKPLHTVVASKIDDKAELEEKLKNTLFKDVAFAPRLARKSNLGKDESGASIPFAREQQARKPSSVVQDDRVRTSLENNGYAKLQSERGKKLYRQVDELDFSTQPNEAVFYSGLDKFLTKTQASALSKRTIEMTKGGSWLDEQNLFRQTSEVTIRDALLIWRKASATFAKQATGVITIFEGRRSYKDMRKSAFRSVETPILENYGKITKMKYKEIPL